MSSTLPGIPAKRKSRGRGREQSFVQYLSFGLYSTTCVGCFLVMYALVLVCLFPMLDKEAPSIPGAPLEGAYIPHAPGQERLVEAASAVRAQIRKIRQGHGVTDASLLEAAKDEFEDMRLRKREQRQKKVVDNSISANVDHPSSERAGFVVLGMHRSGTSMLSGLLVTGCGYNVGGPLIGAAFDNEKGFFERIDVVLQNDEFMQAQNIGWASNVISYDAEKALEHKKTGRIKFKEGERALQFLNDPAKAPWLHKDPRMCITLPTWLKLLNSEPAVVFTYRHPLEVAMSLKKRERDFTLEHGLRLWIIYNMRAIQNSKGLCRVLSSNEAILSDPLNEVQRIVDELTNRCGVPSPPNRLTKEDVEQFINPELQHNKKKREEEMSQKRILADHDGCIVRDFESDFLEGTPNRNIEIDRYEKAMKVYCDLKSGKAYDSDYAWPVLG